MDRAAKQQQRASAPPPVVRRTSRYDHYTTVVMRRLSNPFRLRRSSTGNTSEAVTVRLDNTTSSKSQQSPPLGSPIVEKQHVGATELTSTQLGFELEQIQTHVDITRARIRHLQELIEYEEPTVSRVTELKRQLKDTHRDLEKLYFQVRGEYGDKTADPIRDVVRAVWQAYRSMVELEEKLRSGMSVVSSPVMESVEKSESGPEMQRLNGTEVKKVEEKPQQGVYIPTGARKSKATEQVALKPRDEKDGVDADNITMSGALQMTRQQRAEVQRASSDALTVLEAASPCATAGHEDNPLDHDDSFHSFPKLHSYRDSHGSAYTRTEETHPEQWPQPRGTVAMRLKREETNISLTLRRPDRVRRGSCNGFTITDMIMRGIEDHRFVIPNLQHIKNHEIRVLKQWLVEEGYVQMTGLISCTEKLLHCLHLLQTGNRYESIAVLFSRSPQQVKDSCHEVMGGLLELYNETVDGDCEHEVYAPLWSICKKFVVNAQKAEAYYGFRWMDLVQVLVALNLYIGRSRGSPSPFRGQPFDWARFLLAKRSAQLRHTSPRVREVRDSSEESDSDGGSDDLSIYDTPVIRIVPFLRDRA